MNASDRPTYDDMADRLVSRFPEVSREQAEHVRDFIRQVAPNYYESRDESHAERRHRERPAMEKGRSSRKERP